jgi:predicted enzyme related to lactoylglutathione lyase
MAEEKGRVIGIGGVFFKSLDPKKLNSWYADHLGIKPGQYGTSFHWRSTDDPPRDLQTAWNIFPAHSAYFDPSMAQFMINYIVDDLDALLAKLQKSGVRIDPKRENAEYGRFAWIYDADDNKIELWEPTAKK